MYTRCPHCQSTYRLTAELLRVADGEVRCGSCNTVFNALHSLRDDWDFPDPVTVPPGDEEELAATGTGIGDTVRETLEFDAPETDWQQFFVQPEVPAGPPDGRTEPGIGDDFGFDDDHVPITVIDSDEALEPGPVPDTAEPLAALTAQTADSDIWKQFLQDTEEPTEASTDQTTTADVPDTTPPPAGEPDSTAVVADSTDRPAKPDAVLDWGPAPVFTPPARSRTGLWFAASLIAAVVLAGQAIHYFRDQLAADPRYSELLQKTYNRLGLTLYPQWPLAAYEIRDTKAIAGNSRPDTLDLLAEIAISGTRPVGLPLLRVVLHDRWGNTVASGVFEPAKYLAETPPAFRLYEPGSVIPVNISLKDPGSEAQGYEIDVCTPDRHQGLRCRNAHDPFRR